MPEMNGYEVCERLKSSKELAGIPVIFLSALGETEDKVKAFQAGAVDYIAKPFRFEEVHARVETHLKLDGLRKPCNDRMTIGGDRRSANPGTFHSKRTVDDSGSLEGRLFESHLARVPHAIEWASRSQRTHFGRYAPAEQNNELKGLYKRSRRENSYDTG